METMNRLQLATMINLAILPVLVAYLARLARSFRKLILNGGRK